MAAPVRYLSGRQQQQKIGIVGNTDNEKVLEVVGRVGIGTTVFDTTKTLDVRGDVEISGILSATQILGDGSQLSNLPATGIASTANVNTTGIITASKFSGNGDFTNLSVSGLSTFTGAIDANGGLDVTGHSELDDVNASGISSAAAFANFDYLQAPFGSTVTFTVTVASKDSSHRYNGTGSGNAYLINGVQAPFLTLTPGRTYRFTNDNTGSHPLKFYLEADKTTEYTSGVNFQNTYTEITVGDETPVVLHYQCTAHGYMGNAIQVNSNVVNTNYSATFRDDVTFTGASYDVVWDKSGDILKFEDNAKAAFGTNSDLQIYSDNSNSYIINTQNNDIIIDQQVNDKSIQIKSDDGSGGSAIYLKADGNSGELIAYHYGSQKFATKSNGIDVTGHTETDTLNVSGISTFVGLSTFTNGDVHIANRLFVGGLEVEGTGSENTFTGINTFTNLLDNTLGNPDTGALNANGGFGVNKNVSFGSTLFVQNAIGINSAAPTTQLDVNGGANVSGALTATSLNVTNKLTTTGLGISIANGTGNTAYIEGPSQIWIDPAPAGAGTTSGLVRIRGDLYVDGTEFIVDVDKVQLGDFRIGIATTTGTNVLLDGAGLGIGSESIEKTITWNNATSALMSSENWNLASGKHYEINGTDVLTSTTLGSGVVNSSLTSVGTLSAVTVSGNITANGNIVGDTATNISGINSVTATSFHGNGANLTGLTANQVGAIADVVSDTTPQLGGNLDLNSKLINGTGGVNITGIITATSFAGDGSGLTNLSITGINTITKSVFNDIDVTGISTFAGNINANGNIVGDNSTSISGINSVTATSFHGALSGNATSATTATNVTVADESSDTTCFPLFVTAATGDLAPKSGSNLTFNSSTGALSATDFNSTSDENLKENIRTIEDPLAKVVQIRGVNFDWKENQKPSVGVIAQEVEKVFPELVASGEKKSVNYNGLIGLLIEVVKEQQVQINSFNERLSKLE